MTDALRGGLAPPLVMADGLVTLYHADVMDGLRALPDETIDCCVTSPPYFALRDYGVDGQLGLEDTPGQYIDRMVGVCWEIHRVLKPTGTFWLNVGDSYVGSGHSGNANDPANATHRRRVPDGLKPKDMMMVPARLALALQRNGWCLRSEIVWEKVNAMPESVQDRPTMAHEMLYLFCKAEWVGSVRSLPISERDASWLAALIDGEGSICFQEHDNNGFTPRTVIRLSIVNTNRALLERVRQIIGYGGTDTPSPRVRGDGSPGRPVYTWQVTSAKAAQVIAAVRPHLIAKQQQADLALKAHLLNQTRKERGAPTTAGELDEKRRLAAACSDLNRGRDVDLSWFVSAPTGRWVANRYYFDDFAVREPLAADSAARALRSSRYDDEELDRETPSRIARPRVRSGNTSRVAPADRDDPRSNTNRAAGVPWEDDGTGRNLRTVWTIPTQPYFGAHFAVWPERLVERMVKAGSSEKGCCPTCGAPWRRALSRTSLERYELDPSHSAYRPQRYDGKYDALHGGNNGMRYQRVTESGWEPTCTCASAFTADDLRVVRISLGDRSDGDPSMEHGRRGWGRPGKERSGAIRMRRWQLADYQRQLAARGLDQATLIDHLDDLDEPVAPQHDPQPPVPATVLDPFAGSGTTLAVARRLGRRAIGIELSGENVALAQVRVAAWYKKHSRPPEPPPAAQASLFDSED